MTWIHPVHNTALTSVFNQSVDLHNQRTWGWLIAHVNGLEVIVVLSYSRCYNPRQEELQICTQCAVIYSIYLILCILIYLCVVYT